MHFFAFQRSIAVELYVGHFSAYSGIRTLHYQVKFMLCSLVSSLVVEESVTDDV